MAIPANPTLATLAAEGLKKAGQTSPDTALTTRAEGVWMEEAKNDIFFLSSKYNKKLKSLYAISVTMCTIGKSRYAMPSDFGGDLTLTILDGNETGTAQSGTVGSITLAADEGMAEAFALGKNILITSGTGVGSMSQITAYSTTTKVASVIPNFTTAPDVTSGYMVIDNYRMLIPTGDINIEALADPTSSGKPIKYSHIGSSTYGEIRLDFAPDEAYGLQMRYYVDLSLTDLSSTLMTTLYRKWRNLWIQKVKASALFELNDSEAKKEMDKYYEYVEIVINEETGGTDLGTINYEVRT